MAEHVHMSPYHFQRTFREWAGTSPKHFLQYLNVEYAKRILQETHASLFDTACEVGLSGTGRLYDLFVNIEGMTPGEYKNGGENLTIHYSFAESPFGEIFVASTDKGICCLEFTDSHPVSIDNLKRKFPNAKYKQIVDGLQQFTLRCTFLKYAIFIKIYVLRTPDGFRARVRPLAGSHPRGAWDRLNVVAR